MREITRLLRRPALLIILLAMAFLVTLSAPPVPIGAQQYSTTGSSPTSVWPPNTRLAEVELAADRPAMTVNNAMFGSSGNVFELQDKTPIQLTKNYLQYSGPNATLAETQESFVLGTAPTGSIVHPIFVRGTRVYAYVRFSGDYSWI